MEINKNYKNVVPVAKWFPNKGYGFSKDGLFIHQSSFKCEHRSYKNFFIRKGNLIAINEVIYTEQGIQAKTVVSCPKCIQKLRRQHKLLTNYLKERMPGVCAVELLSVINCRPPYFSVYGWLDKLSLASESLIKNGIRTSPLRVKLFLSALEENNIELADKEYESGLRDLKDPLINKSNSEYMLSLAKENSENNKFKESMRIINALTKDKMIEIFEFIAQKSGNLEEAIIRLNLKLDCFNLKAAKIIENIAAHSSKINLTVPQLCGYSYNCYKLPDKSKMVILKLENKSKIKFFKKK